MTQHTQSETIASTPLSYLLFALPALLLFGLTTGLIAQDQGSLAAASRGGAV